MALSKPEPLLHPDQKCNFSRSSLALKEQDKESGSCPTEHEGKTWSEFDSYPSSTLAASHPPHPHPSQHLSASLTSKDCA